MQNSKEKMKKSEIQLFNRENNLAIFDEKIEIRERCKGAVLLPSSLFAQILAKCRFRRVFLRQMSFSQGSATFYFLFWIYFSCGFSAVAFSLKFSIYVVGSPLACPLGRLGPLPHPLVSLVSTTPATTLNHVQTPWNFVEEFGIAGNPNKGHSVSSQLDQTEP